ncbi:hypothetical protein AMECASPLE_039532 [Ameca splendens]|uniref:Uncharacterized protein n=1 Tax=Ameca splendens TaxID=208324 RepID=A0ABV0XXU6_9TELE
MGYVGAAVLDTKWPMPLERHSVVQQRADSPILSNKWSNTLSKATFKFRPSSSSLYVLGSEFTTMPATKYKLLIFIAQWATRGTSSNNSPVQPVHPLLLSSSIPLLFTPLPSNLLIQTTTRTSLPGFLLTLNSIQFIYIAPIHNTCRLKALHKVKYIQVRFSYLFKLDKKFFYLRKPSRLYRVRDL